ncbi:MAG: dihydroneopterin aldolase [Bacteroidota bacterium]
MHKIEIRGIKCFGFHGCLNEEAKIGQEYIVNVELETNFSKAIETDELNDTIDYCEVFNIVKAEMMLRKKLIEVLGHRIAKKIKNNWESIEKCTVEVIKPYPPIGGEVQEVSISVTA